MSVYKQRLNPTEPVRVTEVNPTIVPLDGFKGQLAITKNSIGPSVIYQKLDIGKTTNWQVFTTGGGGAAWGSITGVLSNQVDLQNALNAKQNNLSGLNNQLFYQQAPNNIIGAEGIFYNPIGKGLNFNLELEPTDNFTPINLYQIDINPQVDSPNALTPFLRMEMNIDANNQGFNFGINGEAVRFIDNDFQHTGLSNIGRLIFTNNFFNIGNGTDPISVDGIAYSNGFGAFNNNVTVVGSIQGYGFQPNFALGASTDLDNSAVNAFYDFANFSNLTEYGFYTSFAAQPIISAIADNKNYSGLFINPQIGAFNGNSNCTAVGIYGNHGVFTSGTYRGVDVMPVIAGGNNHSGIKVDMTNVIGTNVRAIEAIGDVTINGDLSFTGALSIGEINAFASKNLVDSGFSPTTIHSLISNIIAPNSQVTPNADIIGVNTASIMNFLEDSVSTSGVFGLGACALALPAVISMETTASVEHVRGSVFALNMDLASTGGTIQNAIACWAAIVPNGITTINRYIGYDASLPFGAPNADDSWAFYCSTNLYNYMAGSLVIGGAQDKTSNLNVGLEIASTTKAFLNARMTTAQRDSLTAINGMQVYNTDIDKLQVYAAGSWVDLH